MTRYYLGPYTPPTYENQLARARKILAEEGPARLWSPHAATGMQCGCGACFCCAALEVWQEHRAEFLSAKERRRHV